MTKFNTNSEILEKAISFNVALILTIQDQQDSWLWNQQNREDTMLHTLTNPLL